MELQKEKFTKKKRPLAMRIFRIIAWVFVSLVALLLLVLLLIQLPSVQNYGRKKVVSFLENKLHTKVEIGKLSIGFPTTLSLQNVYFEDQSKDTLLYGGEIKVNLRMLQLLRKDIQIREISFDHILAKVKRLPPDSVFNFQFIADAFARENEKDDVIQDSTTLKMKIDRVLVNNTQVIYKDAFTGNDMNLIIGHLDTRIITFDPDHLLFNVPSLKLKGLRGYFYQKEPLQKPIEKTLAEAAAAPENFLKLFNKEMSFEDIDVLYNNDAAHVKTHFIIDQLLIHPKKIDLKNNVIRLDDGTLENSTIIVNTASTKLDKKPKDTAILVSVKPFKFITEDFTIKKSRIHYDDASSPPTVKGMDYSHLKLQDLSLHSSYFEYGTDTLLAIIKSAKVKEKSGFELDSLRATFYMIPTGVFLSNLYIKTPTSEIKDKAYITYSSLEDIKKSPGELGLFIDLKDSKISLKDLYTFVPQLDNGTAHFPLSTTLFVDTKLTGKVSEMHFDRLRLRGLSNTNINLDGVLKGLPNTHNFFANLNIHQFQTSKKDILSILPENTLPNNITIPNQIAASGKINGSLHSLRTDLNIRSSLGDASAKGSLINITDSLNAKYDLVIHTQNLQLGTIIQNKNLGNLTGNFKIKGRGYVPQKADAVFSGTIANVGLNQYNYKNISVTGNISNTIYQLDASVKDPNLAATFNASGSFQGKYPGIILNATIDSIKTLPLHLTDSSIIYHGKIAGTFRNTDPNRLSGNMLITNSIFVNNDRRVKIDTIRLKADNQNGIQDLSLESGFLYAHINGKYQLTQLGSVFQQIINPYFSLNKKQDSVILSPYKFTLDISANDHPVLRALLPDLKQMKPIAITGKFSSDTGISIFGKAPFIEYGNHILRGAQISASTKNSEKLNFKTSFENYQNGNTFNVYATTLDGSMKDNVVDFDLKINDQHSVEKYTLGGILSISGINDYTLNLKPRDLMLNYEKWQVAAGNSIQYVDSSIIAKNFTLKQGNQKLILNSLDEANSPLQIDFENFKLKTFTAIANQDSTIINGLVNGRVIAKNIQSAPIFLADVKVQDLSIYKDTIGNLTAKIDNQILNKYHVDAQLTGRDNQVELKGNYFVDKINSHFDLALDIEKFQVKSLEGFSKGAIKDSRGFLFGHVKVDGTTKNPNIDGKINFDNTSFNITTLNSVFRIDKEAIAIINNKGIEFDKFTIRDTINNSMTLSGMANSTNFMDYQFNMNLNAQNFQAINSTKKDNKLFYGKMVFSTKLKIKGTPTHPIVDGDFTVEDNTDFTVVLPQGNQGIESREGIVRFVDRSATAEDSLFMRPYDSLNVSQLTGYDVSVNINVKNQAVFNLIVDEGNGDFLRLKGAAQLNGGIDASGKITLVGSYEIDEGSYDLSFNFLKRKFNILKGSRIVWTGEPTTAQIDVTATYTANTAPLDLVGNQLVGDPIIYRQKLPFEVYLMMNGELLKPQISFDVVLPAEKNYSVSTDVINTVQNKLIQLRQEPANMNKQVFALLLLNRFVGEDPFSNSASGGLDAGTFAKQSVSKLLTEQLNSLAANLIDGVGIDFDVATTEDYTTGKKLDRTNFNVAVSKRLLNDRLTVTVGSNFELEGPQANGQQNNFADNININYKLSKDGRYALRFYRKNDYTGTLEGYVVETGLGFVITVDYNKFKEIFSNKEKRRKKREIKKNNKEIKKEEELKHEKEEEITSPTNEKKNENS